MPKTYRVLRRLTCPKTDAVYRRVKELGGLHGIARRVEAGELGRSVEAEIAAGYQTLPAGRVVAQGALPKAVIDVETRPSGALEVSTAPPTKPASSAAVVKAKLHLRKDRE